MKNLFSTIFFVCFTVLILSSCQDDNLSNDYPESNGDLSKVHKFKYKGVEYYANYKVINSEMIFENEEMEQLLDKIYSMPQLATYYHKDGSYEYFESDEVLRTKLKLDIPNDIQDQPTTRSSTWADARLTIYEHKRYGGRTYTYEIGGSIYIPDLRKADSHLRSTNNINFNDMISSAVFSLTNYGPSTECTVTFYRDYNYGGQSITWVISPWASYPSIMMLDDFDKLKVKKGVYWNDRISSLIITSYYLKN